MRKKSVERFNEIIKVFTFYGFEIVIDSKLNHHKNSPKNLRKAFEELGPTFIKIGQIVSTRTDLLPKEYIDELVKLQDSVKEESFSNIKVIFEESLNKKISDCFIEFNKKPIASASIAQAYEGILNDGRNVVVKIQRPDICETMRMDISILRRILKFTKLNLNLKFVDLIDILNEIESSIEKELDFITEGKNIRIFKENNKNVAPIYVPDLIEELWSDKVLVLEEIDGFKVTDLDRIEEEGYDNKDIAKKLALSYCKQIFDDGFFHGDPHPGNILIYNKKICFIDFGIMGELSEDLRFNLNKLVFALITGDKQEIVNFLLRIGVRRGKINRGKLYEDVDYLTDMYLTTSLKNIKLSIIFEEVSELARNNNIQFPRDLVSLFRGLVILEGVVVEIDSEVNILSIISSFTKSKGKGDLLREISGEELLISAYSFVRDSIKVPSKIIEVLDSVSDGRSKLNLNINNIEKIVCNIHNMVNRLTGGLLISSLVIGSSLIINDNVGPMYRDVSLIGVIGYIISALCAIILLISMVKAGHSKKNCK